MQFPLLRMARSMFLHYPPPLSEAPLSAATLSFRETISRMRSLISGAAHLPSMQSGSTIIFSSSVVTPSSQLRLWLACERGSESPFHCGCSSKTLLLTQLLNGSKSSFQGLTPLLVARDCH